MSKTDKSKSLRELLGEGAYGPVSKPCGHTMCCQKSCTDCYPAAKLWTPQVGETVYAPDYIAGPCKVVSISEGYAWLRYIGDEGTRSLDRGAGITASISALRAAPKPKRKVTKRVWLFRDPVSAGGWRVADSSITWSPTGDDTDAIAGPVTVEFEVDE